MANDVTKLPKWAQDEISRLKKNVEHWRQKALAASREDGKSTNTALVELGALDEVRGLPPNAVIRFNPTRELDDNMDGEIDIWVQNGCVKVMARRDRLAVSPESSNVVTISPIER